MGLFDLLSDVVDVAGNVGRVVLTPVEVVAKGAKAMTDVVADLAEEAKDALTK